jgi:hypothetical protein
LTETISGDGTINLNVDTTYLDKTAGGPYTVVLPNGNHRRQIKRIYVPGGSQPTTATFNVTGLFVGFTSLQFTTIATSAVLEWDGAKWQSIGGNADTIP